MTLGQEWACWKSRKLEITTFRLSLSVQSPRPIPFALGQGRGGQQRDSLEVEGNLQDAMHVCHSVPPDSLLVPGGWACEMAVAHVLTETSKAIAGVEAWPYKVVDQALEVIPRTLIQNSGTSTIRLLTSLQAKHT